MKACSTTNRRVVVLTLGVVILLAMAGIVLGDERPKHYLKNAPEWFAGDEAKRIADNIVACQSDLGGWPKNVDTTTVAGDEQKNAQPTFDNGATTDELRFLVRIYQATKDEGYRVAFQKGMDYILKAQYPTGGWPQHFPPGTKYNRHITFNDDAMVRLMLFLREIYSSADYAFVDGPRRAAAHEAFDRGIECILKCQIKVDGKLTAWCAQHDELNFSPRPARTYELVSLSGSESVEIVRLLMSLDTPSPEVARAIDGAVAWFETVKLEGIRQIEVPDEKSSTGKNKVIVKDPLAPPKWARFYEIGTNRPMFSDRDGVVKYDLAEIGYERRNGYGWYNDKPLELLTRDYPAWKKKITSP